jgi:hypothetical protein
MLAFIRNILSNSLALRSLHACNQQQCMQAALTRRVSTRSEPTPRTQAVAPAGASAATGQWPQAYQRCEPAGVNTGVRPWEFTCRHPLATSRLEFEVCGHTLIVSCKTPADASDWHNMLRTVAFFVFIIAVSLLPTLEARPDASRRVSQGIPVTLIFVVYLMYTIAWVMVRRYLKPQLLISPEGWSVSYCAWGRPDSRKQAPTSCDISNELEGSGPEAAPSTPSFCGTRSGEGAVRINISAHASMHDSAEASGVTAATTGNSTARSYNAPESPSCSRTACTGSACAGNRSANYSVAQSAGHGRAPASQRAAAVAASADVRGTQALSWGQSARNFVEGMHGVHDCGVSSHRGSDGPLPASHCATNHAVDSASYASLSASPMHGDHACRLRLNGRMGRGRFSPADVGCVRVGRLGSMVRKCMELCGRGESLRDEVAWEPVLGAKVRCMCSGVAVL